MSEKCLADTDKSFYFCAIFQTYIGIDTIGIGIWRTQGREVARGIVAV